MLLSPGLRLSIFVMSLLVLACAKPRAGEAAVVETISGKAENAKLSAVIIGERGTVHCLNFERWPDQVSGRRIRVRGHVEWTEEFKARVENGEISQGTEGSVQVIRRCEIISQ